MIVGPLKTNPVSTAKQVGLDISNEGHWRIEMLAELQILRLSAPD